jgi:hypothetical protein
MAHEFRPKRGNPLLPIGEVTRRLQTAFKHVELDVERASRDLEGWIRFVIDARSRGATAYTDEKIERARRAIGRSVFVIVADDPDTEVAYLAFSLEPEDEMIFVGYESEEQERASVGLRRRLAKVLDYEMKLV